MLTPETARGILEFNWSEGYALDEHGQFAMPKQFTTARFVDLDTGEEFSHVFYYRFDTCELQRAYVEGEDTKGNPTLRIDRSTDAIVRVTERRRCAVIPTYHEDE